MALNTIHPRHEPANGIVAAYLMAHAKNQEIDASGVDPESVETRTAQFAFEGAEHYAMAWGIDDAEHGALVALLAANRLQSLIEGYAIQDEQARKVVTFGIEELYEVWQIKAAMLNLWRFLDPQNCRRLQPLARELRLIDDKGNHV